MQLLGPASELYLRKLADTDRNLARQVRELLELVRNKMIAPIPVTTMPLAKANEALTDLQKGKLVGRAVLTP